MKNRKNIWKITLSLLITGSMIFAVGCSDDEDEILPDGDTPGKVYDIDGNEYKTVRIGDQIWMAENLRVSKYNNGDAIPTGLSDGEWENTTDGAYAIYPHGDVDGIESSEEMVEAYGRLYNWYAVDDPRGLCPEGWRVPTDDEWGELINYVVAQGYPNSNVSNGAGNALKSCRQVDSPLGGDCDTEEHPRWESKTIHHGFDEFGFSALPGGGRWLDGSFSLLGARGFWGSSSEASSAGSWARYITHLNGTVDRLNVTKSGGFSLRCVRDIN